MASVVNTCLAGGRFLCHLLLCAALLASVAIAQGSVVTNDATDVAGVHAGKPANPWTTRDLRAWGFRGCVAVADDLDGWPVAHVVRLPVAEGWGYVRMPQREVAARLAVFGGTVTTRDDVKIVGSCYDR